MIPSVDTYHDALPWECGRAQPVVACACGRSHTDAAWRALPWVGWQDDGAGGRLALRNCHCGSTLARETTLPATT